MPYQEIAFVPYEVTPILPRSIVVAGSVTLWVPYTDGDNPLMPSLDELIADASELRKRVLARENLDRQRGQRRKWRK